MMYATAMAASAMAACLVLVAWSSGGTQSTVPTSMGSEPESAFTGDTKASGLSPEKNPRPVASTPVSVVLPGGKSVRVDPVGTTPGGAMGVPRDPGVAGWWEHGPAPGNPGTAVLAGHNGWNGRAVAFASLPSVRVGDTVIVVGESGSRVAFEVRGMAKYPADADVPEVFGGRDGSWLSLVTCVGKWDEGKGTHSTRLVVYCERI